MSHGAQSGLEVTGSIPVGSIDLGRFSSSHATIGLLRAKKEPPGRQRRGPLGRPFQAYLGLFLGGSSMPRTKREPWFRSEDNWWYGQIGHGNRRRQERLVEGEKNKKAAIRLYRQLLKEGKADDLSGHSTVRRVFIAFLKKHSKAKCSAETHAWYRHYLKSFAKRYGTTRVGKLKVLDAEDWLRSKKWSDTTKNRAVTCLKVALNWAVKVGILKENPLQNLEKPPMGRRERILTP